MMRYWHYLSSNNIHISISQRSNRSKLQDPCQSSILNLTDWPSLIIYYKHILSTFTVQKKVKPTITPNCRKGAHSTNKLNNNLNKTQPSNNSSFTNILIQYCALPFVGTLISLLHHVHIIRFGLVIFGAKMSNLLNDWKSILPHKCDLFRLAVDQHFNT